MSVGYNYLFRLGMEPVVKSYTSGLELINDMEIYDPTSRRRKSENIKAFFHGLKPTFLYEIRWEAEKWLQYSEIRSHPLSWDVSLYTEFHSRFGEWTPPKGCVGVI